jgi:HD superfamily phosphohydrolase
VSDKLSSEEYARQLGAKYGDRRKPDFERELQKVQQYFEAVSGKLSATYTIDSVLAVGGTGIVHKGHHNRFQQPVVVKINRPNFDAEGVSMVEREAQVLPALSHPNIIRVLDLWSFPDQTPQLTYIVEPFISGSKPLFTPDKEHADGTWLHGRLEELKRAMPSPLEFRRGDESAQGTEAISRLLADLAALFSQWVYVLSYIHSAGPSKANRYVYLDVKPENVLIDEHLRLTSIDYGSAEHLDASDQSPVEAVFTEQYAHPELLGRQRHKTSSNRVRSSFKRQELTPALDYYALGISMLEVLNEVAETRPHVVPQLPLYRSLHFLATRLLDGHNSVRSLRKPFAHASQVFQGLKDSDYKHIRYENLNDAHRDLEKERGRWSLEDQVPELATYSKDIVRVVPGYNTVLTPRLRSVIEHPLVARLKCVTQLGLVSLVYPTADHSRYDHALGSYTYSTYYVKSLFNDLGSPLFRNLVGKEDLSAALLAALLHDLGQYPLAHDLEEVHPRIFTHGLIGADLLEDAAPDWRGRTLRQIIEDPEHGWGVPWDLLRRIIGAHSKNLPFGTAGQDTGLKTDVLSAIVDGPVDADKADYIIRDSGRCELPYGSQLDVERFLRVLTVAIIPEEANPVRRVTLGVYDKGIASAHAFGQARHQLFSTVYWHHTSRIAKAMLQYATVIGLPQEVFGPNETTDRVNKEFEIRERLLEFVKSLKPPFDLRAHDSPHTPLGEEPGLDLSAEPPDQVIATVPGDSSGARSGAGATKGMPWYPGVAWTDWLMMRWVGDLPNSSDQSRNLIDGILARRLYKRIAAFPRGAAHEHLIQALEERLWPERLDLCKRLHERIYDELSRNWAKLDTQTNMTQSAFEELCSSNLLVLLDIPIPSKKMGYDRPLGVVPELKEKSYQQNARAASEDKSWSNIMQKMMEGIAPVRVLCHPDIRNLVSALFEPVETAMAKELSELLTL